MRRINLNLPRSFQYVVQNETGRGIRCGTHSQTVQTRTTLQNDTSNQNDTSEQHLKPKGHFRSERHFRTTPHVGTTLPNATSDQDDARTYPTGDGAYGVECSRRRATMRTMPLRYGIVLYHHGRTTQYHIIRWGRLPCHGKPANKSPPATLDGAYGAEYSHRRATVPDGMFEMHPCPLA